MEGFLIISSIVLTIVILRWIWLININAQKIKKLNYAMALLQYQQVYGANGEEKLDKIFSSIASDLNNPLIDNK